MEPEEAIGVMPEDADGPRGLTRRAFFRTAAAGALAAGAASPGTAQPSMDVIDCHIHLYDPGRPQGVPWPDRADTVLYRPVYPRDYKAVALPHGVTGAIVVEASAWIDDNAWVLDLVEQEPLVVGVVGRLEPGQPGFSPGLARFAAHRRFRGIRVAGRDVARLLEPAVVRDLEALAARGLTLDVNGDVASLPTVAALARRLPALRIVVNHVANVAIDGKAPPAAWLAGMDAVAAAPNVWCKVSGLVEGTGRRAGRAPDDTGFYRPVLDAVWERFGEQRVVYGSNWPVSEVFAPFGTVHRIVQQYVRGLGPLAERRYFGDNARAAYERDTHL